MMNLRTQFRDRRRQIAHRDEKNQLIAARLLPFLIDARLPGFYMPLPEEADGMAAAQTPIAAPRVLNLTDMKFYLAHTLAPGSFGVLEPQGEQEVVPDVVIVPMLAFCDGYRIGYGKGYYDRYLASHPACRRIGIAYDEQEACFEPEPWDQRLDVLITPTRTLFYPRPDDQKEGIV